jgi:hypothetical protein
MRKKGVSRDVKPIISLDSIEVAMRPNFCWMQHHSRRFMTNPTFEGHQSVGIIIFIKLAELHGHDPVDIMDYLGIEPDEYREKKSMFDGEYKNKRFQGKVHLVLNAISRRHKSDLDISSILKFKA